MEGLFNFLSPEAGQRRTKWLNDAINDNLSYFLGPTGIDSRLSGVAEMNPVNDIYRAGGDMRDGDYVGAAVNTATAAAPLAATPFMKGGGRAAAETLEDVLTGVSVGAQGAVDAAKRFALSEDGGLRLWHGSPHDFNRFDGGKVGTGSSDAIDGRGIYLTDDQAEAISYKRPDLRSNPFAPPEAQKFSGGGNLYETALNVAESDILPTRSPITELPENVQEMARKRFRADDEFAEQRNLSWYLEKDPALQDEIAGAGYKGFSAERGGNKNYIVFNDRDVSILSKNGKRTPQGEAQTVLDLLRAGNADQVTDDMMAAADDLYLFDNYDLPMDAMHRHYRASKMGYDIEPLGARAGAETLYHQTPADIMGFKLGQNGEGPTKGHSGGGAIWASEIPHNIPAAHNTIDDVTGEFSEGVNIMPIVTKQAKRVGIDQKWDASYGLNDQFPRVVTMAENDRLTSEGFTHGTAGTEVAILDPTNIRSRFARFDPRLAHLRNLSAGVGGISAYNAMTAEEKHKEKVRKYLKGGT